MLKQEKIGEQKGKFERWFWWVISLKLFLTKGWKGRSFSPCFKFCGLSLDKYRDWRVIGVVSSFQIFLNSIFLVDYDFDFSIWLMGFSLRNITNVSLTMDMNL